MQWCGVGLAAILAVCIAAGPSKASTLSFVSQSQITPAGAVVAIQTDHSFYVITMPAWFLNLPRRTQLILLNRRFNPGPDLIVMDQVLDSIQGH
jgi:hypothetical protein